MKIKQALKVLQRATRGLKPDQLRVARGNARTRIRRALKAVQAAVDLEFPAIRKPPQRAPLPTTVSGKKRRLQAAIDEATARGWVELPDTGAWQQVRSSLLQGGIRVRVFGEDTYAPGWAVTIARFAPKQLQGTKAMTPKERKALAVSLTLQNTGAL